MDDNKNAWNSFVETGRIDDYLTYCQNRKQELYARAAEETSDANEDRRSGSVGPQDRGRQDTYGVNP